MEAVAATLGDPPARSSHRPTRTRRSLAHGHRQRHARAARCRRGLAISASLSNRGRNPLGRLLHVVRNNGSPCPRPLRAFRLLCVVPRRGRWWSRGLRASLIAHVGLVAVPCLEHAVQVVGDCLRDRAWTVPNRSHHGHGPRSRRILQRTSPRLSQQWTGLPLRARRRRHEICRAPPAGTRGGHLFLASGAMFE